MNVSRTHSQLVISIYKTPSLLWDFTCMAVYVDRWLICGGIMYGCVAIESDGSCVLSVEVVMERKE